MKHKLISTEKARVLIVDLPADVTGKLIISNIQVDNDLVELTGSAPRFLCSLPPGTWLPDGKLGEATEEVAAKMVEKMLIDKWRNYLVHNQYYEYLLNTAAESVCSLVEANVKLKNKISKPDNYELWARYGDYTQYGKSLTEECIKWQAEEETVFRNPFLFFHNK
ncbi:hypothetical protein LL912_00730 [Niabella sp. CC-SYL272]|uniref:hypothetical protein n=1 Tax=Niabella agricola TaxID=2891571 RepID=UPI001F183C8E|nr:hypothetical protein [Niabella agricola]MCF3107291.1 hypothetical protein [Niabella agricola]